MGVVVSKMFIILYDLAGIYTNLQASQNIPCHTGTMFTASCYFHHHVLPSPSQSSAEVIERGEDPIFIFLTLQWEIN